MLRSRSHLLAARNSPHCPSSSALLLKDELLDFEHLRSSLSSSVWPADASVEESARVSTAVSMAAAAQAVRGDRACLSHHLLQLCWLHALPASRAAQIATRSEFKGEANGCFVWVSVAQMTFFGLLRSSTPRGGGGTGEHKFRRVHVAEARGRTMERLEAMAKGDG